MLDQRVSPDTIIPGGEAALIMACEASSAPMVQLLYQRGANANVRNAEGTAVLALASRGGDSDIVSALLQSKAFWAPFLALPPLNYTSLIPDHCLPAPTPRRIPTRLAARSRPSSRRARRAMSVPW